MDEEQSQVAVTMTAGQLIRQWLGAQDAAAIEQAVLQRMDWGSNPVEETLAVLKELAWPSPT